MSTRPLSGPRRFAVAVSFPGEHRPFVLEVVRRLAEVVGRERVFYDEWYEHELVGTDGDLKLRRYYREQSDVVVPFFSEHYKKDWCQIEWSAIRAMLKERRQEDAVIPVQLDDTEIEGWESIDFAIRRNGRSGHDIADQIVKAYRFRFPETDDRSAVSALSLPPHATLAKFAITHREATELKSDNSELPTLGYLIEQLEKCERDWRLAKNAQPKTTASHIVAVVEAAVRQMQAAYEIAQRANSRYRELKALPGFDKLQAYCEAEWGEDLNVTNAKRIRGKIRLMGKSVDEVNAMSIRDAGEALGFGNNLHRDEELHSSEASHKRSQQSNVQTAPLTFGGTSDPPRQPASSPALKLWHDKLDYLLAEEAKASDAAAKFKIQQDIKEAREKIDELEHDK